MPRPFRGLRGRNSHSKSVFSKGRSNMNPFFKRALVGLAGSAALAALAAATPAAASSLSVRFAWYMPPNTPTADQGNAIAKQIEADSKGAIKVSTYPSGSLANESRMGDAIANNTANMGIAAMHWWSSRAPSLEWDTIPFLTTDADQLLKALHGKLGDDINGVLNKQGVEIIGWGFYGYAESYVNTKHAIKVPTDLKGLKMRSEGSLSADFLKAQGAIPVAVDSSEVYTALQRGTLDGAASGMDTIVSRKWVEVGKYITPIHYVPLVYPIQVNLKWWKGLSDDQRAIIKKAVAETEEGNVADIEKSYTTDIADAKKAGDEIYTPTDADLKAWKAATYDAAVKGYLAKAGAEGKTMLADLKAGLGQEAN
ncbi:TRAP transporter substrate-binding protein [Thioclava sp. BHET1]|nr:TRAP transporter substrate-binding protein [Thioclava sp. BHET1]